MKAEQKRLAYKAINDNVEHTTARQIVRYVLECELWRQDTVTPSNSYLAKKYNWSIETVKVAISKAKKSQFITTTGYGNNRCLELNVSFLKGKMAEIYQKTIKPEVDFSDVIPNRLANTLANSSANTLANTLANSLEDKKSSTEPLNTKKGGYNNNNNNNNKKGESKDSHFSEKDLDEDGMPIEGKKPKKPRDSVSYSLALKCSEFIYKQTGVKPDVRLKEIAAVAIARKKLKDRDILAIIDDACATGFAQKYGLSLNAILSQNQVNKYLLENA